MHVRILIVENDFSCTVGKTSSQAEGGHNRFRCSFNVRLLSFSHAEGVGGGFKLYLTFIKLSRCAPLGMNSSHSPLKLGHTSMQDFSLSIAKFKTLQAC